MEEFWPQFLMSMPMECELSKSDLYSYRRNKVTPPRVISYYVCIGKPYVCNVCQIFSGYEVRLLNIPYTVDGYFQVMAILYMHVPTLSNTFQTMCMVIDIRTIKIFLLSTCLWFPQKECKLHKTFLPIVRFAVRQQFICQALGSKTQILFNWFLCDLEDLRAQQNPCFAWDSTQSPSVV